jgi:hypothetical protein
VLRTEDLPLGVRGLTPPRRGSYPDGLSANEILSLATGRPIAEEWASSSSSSEGKAPGSSEGKAPSDVLPNTPSDYPAFTPEQLVRRRQDSKW